jgi:hypothetical protein
MPSGGQLAIPDGHTSGCTPARLASAAAAGSCLRSEGGTNLVHAATSGQSVGQADSVLREGYR